MHSNTFVGRSLEVWQKHQANEFISDQTIVIMRIKAAKL